MADIPFGTIVMYSGTSIPDGWLLCDGKNDTPNLIDKFIFGGNLNNHGASNSKSVENHNDEKDLKVIQASDIVTLNFEIEVAGHALTESEMPSHAHNQGDLYDLDYGFAYGHWTENSSGFWINGGKLNNNTSPRYAPYTSPTGGGGTHSHNAVVDSQSTMHQHNTDIMPPYYILAFIIYVG